MGSIVPSFISKPKSGAAIIAQGLYDLGVRVIFGLVGIPVVQIAEEAIALGIRFIAFRNEQAASYAATAYGYLTGRPGVCLVVGGPGVLHAMAGIGNSSANAFPLLLLAGSCETSLINKGAFQELDAISLLTPHTKKAVRITAINSISNSLSIAYRTCWYGRAGTSFVDLPADIINAVEEIRGSSCEQRQTCQPILNPPRAAADPEQINRIAELLRTAKSPLLVLGKGAAYARAEGVIRQLVEQCRIPFLPTPMGKGVLQDSHPLNTSSARSAALKHADVVLLLGARLNWILHFGDSSKWNENTKFIQVDSCPEEIGHNNPNPDLGLLGDIGVITSQLLASLNDWSFKPAESTFWKAIQQSKEKNEINAAKTASRVSSPMNYHQVFSIIKKTLHKLSPSENGNIVYVSEGANTMDISRSVFPVEQPRLRMDAGTYATMGVGLGYAIAAHCAHNLPQTESSIESTPTSRKKIVCLEGDSAFGFSMPEIETMARYGMDILVFVINNGGIYRGDGADSASWLALRDATINGDSKVKGLRSTSLGWEVGYEKMAEMCGGKGFQVRTPEELERATEEGFHAGVPTVVNVIIESGSEKKLEFAWQKTAATKDAK